jgi:ketopantoate reductase
VVIVGKGRIGTALALRAERAGLPVTVLSRGASWPVDGPPAGTPIVLAVRTDDLEAAIRAVPAERHGDLVLIQNGALRDWLAARGWGGLTRAALYLLVAAVGDEGVVGSVSPVSGPRAAPFVDWLQRLGVASIVVQPARFVEVELEKLVWLAANGCLCAALQATVGEVVRHHGAPLRALIGELLAVGGAAWNVAPDPERVYEEAADYSLAIPAYRASVKEWEWRNGWFVQQARRQGIPTPLHDEWLVRSRRTERP